MNNERVTLAQELHDGIAQELVALGFSIDQAISQSQEPEVKSSLRAIRFTTTDLIEKLRTQMHQLRSDEPLADESVLVDTMHELLRIVQEILRNIEKHAEADTVQRWRHPKREFIWNPWITRKSCQNQWGDPY